MPEIVVTINLEQDEALKFVTDLARDDSFREQLATNPLEALASRKITISSSEEIKFSGILPPKHVVEEALVNIEEASEFASGDGSSRTDPFGFWAFLAFIST